MHSYCWGKKTCSLGLSHVPAQKQSWLHTGNVAQERTAHAALNTELQINSTTFSDPAICQCSRLVFSSSCSEGWQDGYMRDWQPRLMKGG